MSGTPRYALVREKEGAPGWVTVWDARTLERVEVPTEYLPRLIRDLQDVVPAEGDELVRVEVNRHWVCVHVDGLRLVDMPRRYLWRVIRALKQVWEDGLPAEGGE